LYPGVTTVELDNLAAETAATMTTRHPDYAILAARIAVSNLHKETKKVFSGKYEPPQERKCSGGKYEPPQGDQESVQWEVRTSTRRPRKCSVVRQGSTLTVVRLPGTSENPVRTSET
jgi:hypothetical protein